ncbi:MAG: flagellar motor switch protein FliG [Chloroflexota bacterium]
MPRRPARVDGRLKAAALLVALGPELSANILKHLPEDFIESMTSEVMDLGELDGSVRDTILEECYQLSLAEDYVSTGGVKYAAEMLQNALGKQKAGEVLEKVTSANKPLPFEFVRSTDPAQLASFIQSEHPQTIALILAHLNPTQSAQVLSSLEAEMRTEVALRLASMDRTAPDVISQVEDVLRRKLSSMITSDYASAGGIDTLVKILNNVDRTTEKAIFESLESINPIMAEEIRENMFVFENIVDLDDISIQRVLREVDQKDLPIALKSCSDTVKQRILSNMSKRGKEILLDDMSALGPMRMSVVEEAQGRIVQAIRKLDDAEEIVISRGSQEDMVV